MIKKQGYRKIGMSKLLVDIPDELHKRLRHIAIDRDCSVKDLVIKLLDENLDDSMSNVEKIMGKRK